jgi:MFS family permease
MPYEGDICTGIAVFAMLTLVSAIVALFLRWRGTPKERAFETSFTWVAAIWIIGGVLIGLVALILALMR